MGKVIAVALPKGGVGKTTILKLILGLLKPSSGRIFIDGVDVLHAHTDVPNLRQKMGMIFQSYAVWPHMTVRQNVAYPLNLRKMDPRERQQRTDCSHMRRFCTCNSFKVIFAVKVVE